MKYDLSNIVQRAKADNRYSILKNKGAVIELKEVKPNRTLKQNSALHLYFEMISDVLNDLGMTFEYKGVTGKVLSLRYTPVLVKETMWKDAQRALFQKESTTELNTEEINQMIDVFTELFSRWGQTIEFPSIESLTKKKHGNYE